MDQINPACQRRNFVVAPSVVACLLAGLIALPLAGGAETRQDGGAVAALPTVATRSAGALGTTAMTVGGSVHPHGLVTTYSFEYGPTAAYGQKTRPAALGPRLAAYYHETWDEGLGGWTGGLSEKDLAHHARGGASGGFVRFSEPSGDDPNHVDGIGTLHLAKYVYPGPLSGMSLFLGGGDPDLRGAKVSLHVRGNGWLPNGSELLWWTQSQSNIEMLHQAGWRRANWAYTGYLLTDLLGSQKWEKAEYRLLNDPDKWTYAGNNLRQANHQRYAYWPIDDSQRHVNGDFFHLLAFVNPQNPPKGSIDFDEFLLVYRNHSLLLPSNGGRLAAAPKDGDPSKLTDGWRHGPGRVWQSAAAPKAPLEFVYALGQPATVHTVQIHQNSEWPAREVEVLVSLDGKTFSPLARKTLPERGVPNANFAFSIDQGLSARASFVSVRILSGYRRDCWGLGEIEVFGAGAPMLTDDEPYDVTVDLNGLKPGATYHYRLAAANASGTAYGEDRAFTVPADARPLAFTGAARRITAHSATLEGRLNAMGQPTEYWFEYGPDANYGKRSASSDGGRQVTPRTVLASLAGLAPSTTYHFRLAAKNQTGTAYGAVSVFRTSP